MTVFLNLPRHIFSFGACAFVGGEAVTCTQRLLSSPSFLISLFVFPLPNSRLSNELRTPTNISESIHTTILIGEFVAKALNN